MITIFDTIAPDRLPQWLAQNRIAALALDRLPSGKLIAAEVRRYEDGSEEHVPLLEMSTADFYALASRLNLPIEESKIATEQERAGYRQAMRRQSERLETARELRGERASEGWNRPE